MPDLERRLSAVPLDRIQTPAPEIAGPLFEELRFTAHNDDLRRLYAKLLGTAMDAETARLAHPSFVELLKQLSPDEARIVRELARELPRQPYVPAISVSSYDPTIPENSIRMRCFSLLAEYAECEHRDLVAAYAQNLIRLGILTPEGQTTTPEKMYPPLESHPLVTEIAKRVIEEEGRRPRFERASLRVTEYGRAFLSACVSVPGAPPRAA